MIKRYFAIGFKNWIEIREATKPPIRHESRTTREVPVPVYGTGRFDPYNDIFVDQEYKPKKYRLRCVNYEGGKVIGTLTAHTFISTVGFGVTMNSMYELNENQMKLLFGKKGMNIEN